MVLSSFYWYNGVQGIPDGLSDCKLCTENCAGCKTVPFSAAYSATSVGYDTTGYTRVHRDNAIINAMRSWINLPAMAEKETK
jgi:alpha-amylase